MTDFNFVNTDEPIVKVFEATDMMEADAVEQLLRSQGIASMTQSNATPGLLPIDMGPLGGVGPISVLVLESQEARARELIQEMIGERRELNNGNDTDFDEDPAPEAEASPDADAGKDAS